MRLSAIHSFWVDAWMQGWTEMANGKWQMRASVMVMPP